jgi:hypothetical protein
VVPCCSAAAGSSGGDAPARRQPNMPPSPPKKKEPPPAAKQRWIPAWLVAYLAPMLGVLIGVGVPILVVMCVQHRRCRRTCTLKNGINLLLILRYEYGPPTAIKALTGKSFFNWVGRGRSCVVLFHAMSDPECMDFRYDFEVIFEAVPLRRTLFPVTSLLPPPGRHEAMQSC